MQESSAQTMATARRARGLLLSLPSDQLPLTYQQLADRLGLQPPHTIHRVVLALEYTMVEDAKADQPFVAALVISRARSGMPAPGFFDLAKRLGRHQGEQRGPTARSFHSEQMSAVMAEAQA